MPGKSCGQPATAILTCRLSGLFSPASLIDSQHLRRIASIRMRPRHVSGLFQSFPGKYSRYFISQCMHAYGICSRPAVCSDRTTPDTESGNAALDGGRFDFRSSIYTLLQTALEVSTEHRLLCSRAHAVLEPMPRSARPSSRIDTVTVINILCVM